MHPKYIHYFGEASTRPEANILETHVRGETGTRLGSAALG